MDGPRHQLLGWPTLIQNPMELECQLASNGIYVGNSEGYRNARVEGLRAGHLIGYSCFKRTPRTAPE
jgi:hypothetical protein